jgi:hypothetical protein
MKIITTREQAKCLLKFLNDNLYNAETEDDYLLLETFYDLLKAKYDQV